MCLKWHKNLKPAETTNIKAVAVTAPQCGKATLECNSTNADQFEWLVNGTAITSLSNCLDNTGTEFPCGVDTNCSLLVLDIPCNNKWLINGTNISCQGWRTFGPGQQPTVSSSDNASIIFLS